MGRWWRVTDASADASADAIFLSSATAVAALRTAPVLG